jgi:hypothetical protein
VTEEMVGGQHRNDEATQIPSGKGENANARTEDSSEASGRVCPEKANTQEKALATADLVRDSRLPGHLNATQATASPLIQISDIKMRVSRYADTA